MTAPDIRIADGWVVKMRRRHLVAKLMVPVLPALALGGSCAYLAINPTSQVYGKIVLRGPARWDWYHSIPPVDRLRYSVTFRNFVAGEGAAR